MLHVIVNVDGRATDITLVKAVGFGLDERAVEAVKKWRFKPALDADGRPVAVQVPIQITFRTR
jgi:periplasmic protein TonB